MNLLLVCVCVCVCVCETASIIHRGAGRCRQGGRARGQSSQRNRSPRPRLSIITPSFLSLRSQSGEEELTARQRQNYQHFISGREKKTTSGDLFPFSRLKFEFKEFTEEFKGLIHEDVSRLTLTRLCIFGSGVKSIVCVLKPDKTRFL